MKKKLTKILILATTLLAGSAAMADVEAAEIYCTIRDTGTHLNCQWIGKDVRRSMTPEETAQFIDRAEVAAYMSVRSRRGNERMFLVDADSAQFKKLEEIKKTGSISEIAKAKFDLFADIEKKAIKISDDLDAQLATTDLVKYDSSVATDKYKRDLRRLDGELVAAREQLQQNANPNPTYENGPSTISNNADTTMGARQSIFAGMSIENYNPSVAGGQSAGAVPSSLNAMYRYVFNNDYYLEVELNYALPTAYNSIGSNWASTGNLSPNYNDIRGYRCWGTWCVALNVAPGMNYVGSQASVASNRGVLALYSDNFAGVSVAARYHMGNWLMIPELAYLAGLGASSVNVGKNASISSESLLTLSWTAEMAMTQHHGVAYRAYLRNFNTVGTNNVSDLELGIGAYYKYSF